MRTSRTLSPLHFEDLEPHRFEDLVRQLAYDFREWEVLEATGRLGGDEGVDIRGVESRAGVPRASIASEDEEEQQEAEVEVEERIWFFQCKREKSIAPARLQKIIGESLPERQPTPYGFVLAAATDFSAKARELFRAQMKERGIEEFALWGKSDLEDLLFEPRHDHLLFAYFGISLQARRRSARTRTGMRMTTKRRLVKAFGEIGRENHQAVLLRDAASEAYPHPADIDAFQRNPAWRYFRLAGHLRVDELGFVINEYWAQANFETGEWDRIDRYDEGYPRHPELWYGPDRDRENWNERENARRFWHTRVPDDQRSLYRRVGFVHYDRIAAIDEVGDRFHEPFHLLLICDEPDRLFDDVVDILTLGHGFHDRLLRPDPAKRKEVFPATLPDISDDDFRRALERRHGG